MYFPEILNTVESELIEWHDANLDDHFLVGLPPC